MMVFKGVHVRAYFEIKYQNAENGGIGIFTLLTNMQYTCKGSHVFSSTHVLFKLTWVFICDVYLGYSIILKLIE